MISKILVVDDDENIKKLISIYLENEGYTTSLVSNAEEALALLQHEDFDLIILDIMLPGLNGIEACIRIREEKTLPIIMISAKSEDLDKIQGLSSGADDYLTKPFNPLELIARVKSQLRRYKKYNHVQKNDESIVEVGDLQLNSETRQVWVRNEEKRLTPKEFEILELLVRNKGIVLSVSKIFEAIWKEDFLKSDNTVMVHITNIRDKIEDDPKHPIYIKTVWGIGYKV